MTKKFNCDACGHKFESDDEVELSRKSTVMPTTNMANTCQKQKLKRR